MRSDTQSFIDDLVGDLRPIRPLTFPRGWAIGVGSVILTVIVMALYFGIRSSFMVENPVANPIFVLATGLFLMLGIAATVTAIGMSRPHVGIGHGGWAWAVAMAALLPLSAIVLGFIQEGNAFFQSQPVHGVNCLTHGSLLGLFAGGALTFWLRRGAPTSPDQAGLLTGIAAGSLGIFAYSLHCPIDDILHIGIWHSLSVALSALLGRLLVPVAIRW